MVGLVLDHHVDTMRFGEDHHIVLRHPRLNVHAQVFTGEEHAPVQKRPGFVTTSKPEHLDFGENMPEVVFVMSLDLVKVLVVKASGFVGVRVAAFGVEFWHIRYQSPRASFRILMRLMWRWVARFCAPLTRLRLDWIFVLVAAMVSLASPQNPRALDSMPL